MGEKEWSLHVILSGPDDKAKIVGAIRAGMDAMEMQGKENGVSIDIWDLEPLEED